MQLDLTAPARRRKISLTPLIDVVFILLLFFMLSSSFMQWRQLDLPIPSQGSSRDQELLVVKLLNNAGELNIDGRQLSMTELNLLRQLIAEHPSHVIALDVAEGVDTQRLITLVDRLRQAGADRVSLAGVLR